MYFLRFFGGSRGISNGTALEGGQVIRTHYEGTYREVACRPAFIVKSHSHKLLANVDLAKGTPW